MKRSGSLIALLVLGVLGALAATPGCRREEPARTPVPAPAPSLPAPAVQASGAIASPEGNFSVVWPSGCEYLRTRTTESTTGKGKLVAVTCDRSDRENEGVAVRVHVGMTAEDGGPPTPRTVIDLVKQQITAFKVQTVSQRPVRRGPLEGVDVLCEEPGHPGQVWIEGLLLGNNVYVLVAWNAQGGLVDEPEIKRFFSSFNPVPEGAAGAAPPAGAPATGAGGGSP